MARDLAIEQRAGRGLEVSTVTEAERSHGARLAPRLSTHTTTAYLVLSLVIGAASAMDGSISAAPALTVAVGVVAVVALVAASIRLRARPTPSWAASQRDPFVAVAVAASVLLAPHVVAAAASGSAVDVALARYVWVTSALAAVLGAAAFLVMIRDLSPGRAVDALYLAAIGALVGGLSSWVLVVQVVDGRRLAPGRAFELLTPAVLDLLALGLGLQALGLRGGARRGCWLLVAAWTVLLAGDTSRLLAATTGNDPSGSLVTAAIMVAFGLLGAAALHPDSSQAVEPVFGPLERLPRSEVVLLAGAVLLGPGILSTGLDGTVGRPLVLLFSGVLSLLVVGHLVRLVQGRAALEHRAHHDELTGLANRTLFGDRAAVAIAHAQRTDAHSAVLFLDLDRFKNVNDSLGHAVGNLLLQAVAKRLRAATRAEDTVARLGGDEFVVFLPQLADPDEAAHVAAKILESFSEPFTLSGHRVFASPSIGIAVFPTDGDDADVLLKNADTAMYRAKQRGRRTFCAYDKSMNDHAHERLALESRLHTAIERGELRLHYQPKVHLPTGRVSGMEALLRWEHPDLGLLEPAEFIALAEESGLIVPLGAWALEEACRQNQAWVDAGFAPLVVAVNLSLRQFQQQQIGDLTAQVLRRTGLDPELLELEVTESLAMQDPEDVRTTLLDLREMGVKCSIDDFGTGYSGLSHLTRFPIDKLKIDKSFVATIDTDWEAPIVVAVVALAHSLGLEVVAEGVETDEQLERLQELGCDEMQGYLFSKPLPPERFEQLLMLESIAPGPGRLAGQGSGVPQLIRAVG